MARLLKQMGLPFGPGSGYDCSFPKHEAIGLLTRRFPFFMSPIREPRPRRPVGRYLTRVIAISAMLASPSTADAGGLDDIPICHGFGCRVRDSVSLSQREWSQIKAFFRNPAETAQEEREQIRKASGWFEVLAGRHSPIHLDKGGNNYPDRYPNDNLTVEGRQDELPGRVGQMDCIDESLNMTTYLTLMEQAGLFRHHRVVERARRRSALDQHYAGQIEEVRTGTRWVVDSWFYDYGSLPYVEKASEWHDIPFLFSTSFPAPSDD